MRAEHRRNVEKIPSPHGMPGRKEDKNRKKSKFIEKFLDRTKSKLYIFCNDVIEISDEDHIFRSDRSFFSQCRPGWMAHFNIPKSTPWRETPMTQEIHELTVEEVESFELEDLEVLLETATEELEPRVAPGSGVYLP